MSGEAERKPEMQRNKVGERSYMHVNVGVKQFASGGFFTK